MHPPSNPSPDKGTQTDSPHAKKKTYGYRERDEDQRKAFVKQLQQYLPEEIVYIDEAGVDDTEDYAYGWVNHSALKIMQI